MNKNKRIIRLTLITIVAAIGIGAIAQVTYLQWAHRTLANYETFRGCETVLETSPTKATCRLHDGNLITMVNYGKRWYLEGDLPHCVRGWCF